MEKERLGFLQELMAVCGPSGFEEEAQEVVRRRLAGRCDEVRTDVHGNVLAGVNTGAALRVMLAGHVDEIGLMITHIDEYGYAYFQSIGGIDTNVLTGQRVIIHTAAGPVPGVIGRKPIHLLTEEERKIAPKMEDLFIDIGAKKKKDAEKHIRVTDTVTIDAEMKFLLNDRVAARAFDDRIGVLVVVETLLEVAKRKPRVSVWSVTTAQEEIGMRGAATSAYGLDPQVGIAVDLGFTGDHPGMDKKRIGDCKIGAGPILGRGPNINEAVFAGLERTAKAKKIPYQVQAEPRATGTDANSIQLSRSGVAAALVSVPHRYTHSPNEVVSLEDVDKSIELLTEYILALRPTDNFVPMVKRKKK